MLDTVFRKRRQIYNYTLSAYSETSHLFFGDKVIQSHEGCITKKQSDEEDFLCRPCQVVDTGAPLPLTIDTLIAVTKATPAILKRVPKHARIPLAKLNEALDGIVAKPHDESCWVSFFLQFCAIMKQPKRSGKRQKSDLRSIICERIKKGPALDDLSSRVN